MRKLFLTVLLAVLVLSQAACANATQYGGSRTGDADRLIMAYAILDRADSQELTLAEGDVLAVGVVREAGSVSVTMQKDAEAAIYRGTDIPTSAFEVGAPSAGVYRCTVTGARAKGGVSIVKRVAE